MPRTASGSSKRPRSRPRAYCFAIGTPHLGSHDPDGFNRNRILATGPELEGRCVLGTDAPVCFYCFSKTKRCGVPLGTTTLSCDAYPGADARSVTAVAGGNSSIVKDIQPLPSSTQTL